MQLNGSQRQLNASDYLAKVSNQINGFVVGYPANKDKFCKHIGKVVREAEKYGQYLRDEWQKAKKAGLTQYKDKEGKQGWSWWIARTNDWMSGESVYFADDEKWDVQFYIEGEPKPDPLYYLSSMIWVCEGQEYEGLGRLDYQFVLLSIIHDAQNCQAGRERIYFNPLEKGTLSDRLCLAAWHRLEKSCQLPYRLRRDIQQTIETAMRAVRANLEQEKPPKDDHAIVESADSEKPTPASGDNAGNDEQATPETYLTKLPAETGRNTAPAKEEKSNVKIQIGEIQAENVQIGNHALIHKEAKADVAEKPSKTRRNTTHFIRLRIWTFVKRIPRWIYVLAVFLAALLTCLYHLGWL